MNNINRIFLALVFTTFALPALASVTASLDNDHVASGQTVQLQLQHDGTTDSQPDLGPLRNDFDVLGTSSGSNVQIINGHMSSQTQVTVLLSPKHDGKILIPPLQWDGQQTAAIELTVGGNGSGSGSGNAASGQTGATSGGSSHIFLTATLDQKQPYVQAADVLTVRLYADQPIFQASLDLPASSDVLVKQLGKDKQSTEMRNGRSYQVVERKYLLFPQRSGTLSLDGPVLDAQVQATPANNPFSNNPFGNDQAFGNLFGQMPLAGMLNATHPIRLHGKTITLDVLKRPAAATGANWLPAQNVTLQETWRPDSGAIHVGDPLTRHLQLAALGLTGAQLPDLGALMQVPDGIKTYPDQSSTKDAVQGDTVLGTRDQDIALIASRPGRFELPEVKLNWWDTVHNIQHVITLPARVLDILPAAGGSAATTTLPPANVAPLSQPAPAIQTDAPVQVRQSAKPVTWIWISAALALLWLGTVLAWWYSRRGVSAKRPEKTIIAESPAANTSASAEFKAFRRACQDNDPQAARHHLLAWGKITWSANPPLGLNELSRRITDAELVKMIRELDRACYTGSEWNGEALGKSFAMPQSRNTPSGNKYPLPELYP